MGKWYGMGDRNRIPGWETGMRITERERITGRCNGFSTASSGGGEVGTPGGGRGHCERDGVRERGREQEKGLETRIVELRHGGRAGGSRD